MGVEQAGLGFVPGLIWPVGKRFTTAAIREKQSELLHFMKFHFARSSNRTLTIKTPTIGHSKNSNSSVLFPLDYLQDPRPSVLILVSVLRYICISMLLQHVLVVNMQRYNNFQVC